mgnify:CR=1 FL=1
MPDLVAKLEGEYELWRKRLPADATLDLGRSSACRLSIPEDDKISRRHATLKCSEDQVTVDRLGAAKNPIFHEGEEKESFELKVGGRFSISRTVFVVEDSLRHDHAAANDMTVAMSLDDASASANLRDEFQPEWLDGLGQLPDALQAVQADADLERAVAEVLVHGIPEAGAAGVLQLDQQKGSSRRPLLKRTHMWDRANKLCTDQKFDVAWLWEVVKHQKKPAVIAAPHGDPNPRWVLCCPLPAERNDRGWAIYVESQSLDTLVSHRRVDRGHLKGAMSFGHLVAKLFASLRQLRRLRSMEAELGNYFSPPVREALRASGVRSESLHPRTSSIAVMFCDLRGSSRMAEDESQDLLAANLRISEALGVMTEHIHNSGGSVGDFQGDSAMGYWGWPSELFSSIHRACTAASNIQHKFQNVSTDPNSPLSGFTCGIGIAAGDVVAGRLGNHFLRKIGVFGPVVNLAARLEGLTKYFRVPVLVNEQAALQLRENTTDFQVRRVAHVVPLGMNTPTHIYQLFSRIVEPERFSDTYLLDEYHDILEQFEQGDWERALRSLESLLSQYPADGPAQFLHNYIRDHGNPPTNWDGIIRLDRK